MKIEEVIEDMSLKQKVGQLFQVGFSGTEITSEIEELIKEDYIGGIIYFSRNIENPVQLAELSNKLQRIAMESDLGIPLILSADQEGGIVTRLQGGTHFPGNMTIGASRLPEMARKAGKATARELKAAGITMNLAPVLDVNNNPDNPVIGVRSFGEDPELVADMGSAYVKGLQKEGVMACGKHFPGHGDTAVDSHLDLPVIDHSQDRLNRVELFPFKKAISEKIDSIMTAHIYFPTIEPRKGVPATLSRAVLKDLLREELGFEGMIITDCMEMEAITSTTGTVEGAIKTLEAGSDTVLISHSYPKQKKAIKAVIKAVKGGRLKKKRINNSVKRILGLKKKYISLNKKPEINNSQFDKKYSLKVAKEISRRGVTLVKDEKKYIPLKNSENISVKVIDFNMGRISPVEQDKKGENRLVYFLRDKGIQVKHITLNKGDKLPDFKEKSLEKSFTIICTYDAVKNKYQREVVNKLSKDQLIVIALRNPYDYELFDDISTFITTYDHSPTNLQIAAEILVGELEPAGSLPVTLEDH
ncbi:MAG: beta-N-acetylhexosaminidase [Halanaerobiales bacterium]